MAYKDKTTRDNNRTQLNLQRAEVEKVLPEYVTQEYPKLVELLNTYYEWLDSADNFGGQINQLYRNRDATQVPNNLLQYLEDELLLGQAYFGGFQNKREAIKFSNLLYRSKGTKYNIQQFFRGFFGLDPVIEYPKNNVFKVGPSIDYDLDSINTAGQQIKEEASKIGPESRRFITDDKLYQIMSVLIKTSLPFNEWKDVYKLFVHPGGVYVAGEVLIEMVNRAWNKQAHNPKVNNNGGINYIMDEIGDSLPTLLGTESQSFLSSAAFSEITLINKGDGTIGMQRQRTDQTFEDAGTFTFDSMGNEYQMGDLLSPNSLYMSDSFSATLDDGVDMSQENTFVADSARIGFSTFDQHEYSTLFDSTANSADSAHYPFAHI